MRDFFERQDAARRLTWRMAAVLAGAVLGTVLATAVVLASLTTILALLQVVATTNFKVDVDYWLAAFVNRFWAAAFLAGAIVIGVAVQRTLRALDSGGAEVARQMGAERVLPLADDSQCRQLINVVEELSIATGVPAPKIFVLEHEPGINAFAAGIEPKDTVVCVTKGALEHLDRNQLQGVLAHEFSHIVNRDVRINVQTLGALQGIEAIASVANYFLRMGVASGVNGSMLATAFGSVLWPVGQIGVLFGSLARMALNRQREFLADAAAVQFTRYPDGLSSALKLIAGQAVRGQLESSAARTASHLFFAEGTSPLGPLLSSHPPIETRIRRLDPDWDGVLPLALPAQVAALLDGPEIENVDDVFEGAISCPVTADARERDAGGQPPAARQVCSDDASEANVDASAPVDGVSAADHQAFLETLAAVRTHRSTREYDPSVTHWPTLAATAAAVIAASVVFTWLTTR